MGILADEFDLTEKVVSAANVNVGVVMKNMVEEEDGDEEEEMEKEKKEKKK